MSTFVARCFSLSPRNRLGLLVFGLVVVSGCTTSRGGRSEACLSRVIHISSQARWSTDGQKSWTRAKIGDRLAVGTIIQTSTDELSYLDMELPQTTWPMPRAGADKGALSLWQDYPHNAARLFQYSVVQITRLNRVRTGLARLPTDEIRLNLMSGTIVGVVTKMGEGSFYEVEFRVPEGVGVARIRSGSYSLRYDGLLHVRRGSAEMSLPGGKPPIEIPSGYVFIARTGELLAYERYRNGCCP